MDFYKIVVTKDHRSTKIPKYTIRPVFQFGTNSDIVCKGGSVYAYWFDNQWRTSIKELVSIIDDDIYKAKQELLRIYQDAIIDLKLMNDHTSGVMKEFDQYTKLVQQSDVQFDSRVIFADETPVREDYSTNKLLYFPKDEPTPAFDELLSKLYAPQELEKILWFIGALMTNNMANIQKFMYLYGAKGTGKGTVINIFQKLFEGYFANISLARLTSGSEFATSQVRELPLLIDSDSKINKIKDDTNLLKLTSHETLSINIKHKQLYDVTFKGLLITASNQRYQVNNIDSGITRRAVVVHPTNMKHDSVTYARLVSQVNFELPGIAYKAIQTFNARGPYYYEDYVDVEMAEATDHIFAFVKTNYKLLGDPCTLTKASELYKVYLDDIGFDTRGYKRKIKEELKRYYNEFKDRYRYGEDVLSNVYIGFKYDVVFPNTQLRKEANDMKIDDLLNSLGLKEQHSIFDDLCKTFPAQYSKDDGTPMFKWSSVRSTLQQLDTSKEHYLRLPDNWIVIDLDIKENGEKSLRRNLEKALTFPKTYTELSKSGKGVHLHYIYDGDVTVLEKLIEEDVEVKIFSGKSSLRRKVHLCNSEEPVHISTGLPEREREKVKMYKEVDLIIWNEKRMRKVVENNLRKQYHPNTKPSMDFIAHVFDEADKQGLKYDLRDLQQAIILFAASSTNQAQTCMKIANQIRYTNIDDDVALSYQKINDVVDSDKLTFFDIEVFPNLLVVVWMNNKELIPHAMVNPTSSEIEELLKKPLVGFNNRRYDNHILYGALLGLNNLEIYNQSKRIIEKQKPSGFYKAAYEISYVDIYEYASKKQSLKKWEVDLGIHHDELEMDWNKPVADDMIDRVVEYCINDVQATKAVFDATRGDYIARIIISKLSKMSVNTKTQDHAEMFIADGNNDLLDNLVYTDLSKEFPGYSYSYGKSLYKGVDPSEGGYVYAKPGIHKNVALLDVKSLHPHSAIALNYFGKYTPRYKALVEARVAVKEKRFDDAKQYFNGALTPYLNDKDYKDLAYALKIIINIVYGMSSANYVNPFRHPDNNDNIVAKRGALFMIDLQEYVTGLGYEVVHIKTDSIKIANYDSAIVDKIMAFAKKYKYEFDFEAVYSTFCLVNKSVYIAKDIINPKTNQIIKDWEAVGKMFAEPYTFKTLFTNEELVEEDFSLIKEVKDASIYLDERFVGRLADVYASKTGTNMYRVQDGVRKGAVNGTKNFGWRLFSEYQGIDDVDMVYYHSEIDKAYLAIKEVGDPAMITNYIPLVEYTNS